MLVAQDRIHITLQRRRRLRIAIDEQRRLLRLYPILIQSPDIRRSVSCIAVLKHVDVVGDAPVDVVHLSAGVEEHRTASGECVLGKGRGLLHVLLAAGVLPGGFVDKEAVKVDVLGRAFGRVPVLVIANVGLELALRDGAGADVGSACAAVVLVRRLKQDCQSKDEDLWGEASHVDISHGLDVWNLPEDRCGIDEVRVWAWPIWSRIGIDDDLEGNRRIGPRDIEQRIPSA